MAKLTDFLGRPHSGQVPFAVVGIVKNNVDPDEMGRIQVNFPTLHQEPVSFWLRQASPNAGKDRGFYALPEKKDEVLVIFMQGSQDVGVIIGQFWNGEDFVPREAWDTHEEEPHAMDWSTDGWEAGSGDIEKNDRRFWKSRSGHLFLFDDTSGEESVQVWNNTHTLCLVFDTANDRIVMRNSVGDIHIRTETDLYLEAGNDIKWKAGNDLIGEAGNNIEEKAGTDIKTEAGSNQTHKSGTAFKIKAGTTYDMHAGAAATLKAGPSMTLKAGTININ